MSQTLLFVKWLSKVWHSFWGAKPVAVEQELDVKSRFKIGYGEEISEYMPDGVIFII